MARQGFWKRLAAGAFLVALAVFGVGCHLSHDPTHGCCHPPKFHPCNIADAPVPKELNKVSLPPYVIETPDILLIDAIRIIPLPPYRVEPLDVLYITGTNVFESNPLQGLYPVDPDGTINLGPAYGGVVRVADMTPEEIQKVVQNKVRQFAKAAEVTVSLAQSRGVQQIAGQHIVRPDGTVGLGSYGSVYVAGMTIAQAKGAIEAHLSKSGKAAGEVVLTGTTFGTPDEKFARWAVADLIPNLMGAVRREPAAQARRRHPAVPDDRADPAAEVRRGGLGAGAGRNGREDHGGAGEVPLPVLRRPVGVARG